MEEQLTQKNNCNEQSSVRIRKNGMDIYRSRTHRNCVHSHNNCSTDLGPSTRICFHPKTTMKTRQLYCIYTSFFYGFHIVFSHLHESDEND